MNISQAKEYIKNSIKIYLKKDEFGDYRIPVVRQRPVFLLGAPGIGKTAIMEQIAQELGIALVSYSMTHHTRQSALGLPFIKQKSYGDMTYDVSEYTMSEIIASVYETMEQSGVKEGILFLDEINCVSETLAPSMLQFLQYKVFGRHSVPEGWVIVTAGNPPEYNKSVREFDVVTMDRLKVLEVEADYKTWKQYAYDKGIHPAILNFLELKKEYFYHMETNEKGRLYVTARGWEDLSEIIYMYEEEKLSVDESLIAQYLRSDIIVREFSAYYDLFNKYKNDYKVDELLEGRISEKAVERAKNASFDERLSLLGLLLDKVQGMMKEIVLTSDYLTELMSILKGIKAVSEPLLFNKKIEDVITAQDKRIEILSAANSLSGTDRLKLKRIKQFMTEAKRLANISDGTEAAFAAIKESFDKQVALMKQEVNKQAERMHNLFEYCSKAFEDGNELLILVTELTVGAYSSRYISMFGCEDYHKYSEALMITERQNDIKESINSYLKNGGSND